MNWLLNKLSPELHNAFMSKVAIVGNSGKMIGSGLGEKIDSFDTVIRFSNSTTEGFEADVGTKETCRFLCYPSSVDGSDFESTLRDKKIILMAGNLQRLLSAVVKLCGNSGNEIYFLHHQYVSTVNATVNTQEDLAQAVSGKIQLKMASLGLIAVTTLVSFFTKPTVFGFDHFSGDKTNYHYYEEYKNKDYYPNRYHNFDAERKIFQQLEKEGLIEFISCS